MKFRPSRRVLRIALLVILVAFVAIQFVPVELGNPPVEEDIAAPPEVAAILRRSCYDCHSHEVSMPWYASVAPVSWLLERDVREGRRELNFSTWNLSSPKRRAHKLEEIVEQTAEGEMPPWFYLPLHPSADLSPADLKLLADWATAESARVRPTSGSESPQQPR